MGRTGTKTATATGLGEIILSAFGGVPGAVGGTTGTGTMTAGGSGTVTTKSMTGSVGASASASKSGPGSGGGSQTTTTLAGNASAGANTNAPASVSASASAKSTIFRRRCSCWETVRGGPDYDGSSDGCSSCWDRCVSGLCASRRAAYVDVRGNHQAWRNSFLYILYFLRFRIFGLYISWCMVPRRNVGMVWVGHEIGMGRWVDKKRICNVQM